MLALRLPTAQAGPGFQDMHLEAVAVVDVARADTGGEDVGRKRDEFSHDAGSDVVG